MYASPLMAQVCMHSCCLIIVGIVCNISAWASKLLIYVEGKFEGLDCKISNRYGSHAFFIDVALTLLIIGLQEVARQNELFDCQMMSEKWPVTRAFLILFLTTCLYGHAQEGASESRMLTANNSVAVNPFSHNWELSLGIQGLSFYSNQENGMNLSQNPFSNFRTKAGITIAMTKWFSPQIGMRTKIEGFRGMDVYTDNASSNTVRYFHAHEDVLLNMSNLLRHYNAGRRYDAVVKAGVGMIRNFTENENAMVLNLGIVNTYRVARKWKVYVELSFDIAGDEFDNKFGQSKNFIKQHDRWFSAEAGMVYELGQNHWRQSRQ